MSSQGRASWGLALMIVASFCALVAVPAGAATQVVVASNTTWTDAHTAVRAHDQVSVQARGRVRFGDPPIQSVAPTGVPWGSQCNASAQVQGNWPAPGRACWSLIGRVGEHGAPFEIGDARTITAPAAGELFLGVNDNLLTDNRGSWTASVAVAAAPTAVTAPAPASSSSSSSTTLILIAVAGGLLLIALAVILLRRRRPAAVAFTLPPELLAASLDIVIDGDHAFHRLDADGQRGPLVLVEDDFEDVKVDRTMDSFVWRGLDLRVVSARGAQGEAFQLGQCVAGSEGTKPTDDGFTKGLLPREFAGGWAFTLRTVDGETVTGTWKVFASGDKPFDQQANAAITSITKLIAVLPTLIARRAQTGLLDARIGR